MDYLSMNYYGGVNFICSGVAAVSTGFFERVFDGYYGIQYSQDGLFCIEVDGQKQEVEGPSVLISYPGPHFKYGTLPGKKRFHAFACFKGPRVEEYIASGFLPTSPKIPLIKINRPERFLGTLKQLIQLLNPLYESQYDRAVHTLEDLILQLHEQTPEGNLISGYLESKLEKLTSRISKTPEESWDFISEAGSCGISHPHFRRIFTQYTGLPPGKFLLRARLHKASGILVSSNAQICEIAEKCGFSDQFYFSRQFKKYYHFSPFRYRREFRLVQPGPKSFEAGKNTDFRA